MSNVSACVVTYNRSVDLIRCVNAILSQSFTPKSILIYNNNSTDDTFNLIRSNFSNNNIDFIEGEVYKVGERNNVEIYLYNAKENTGGSGGFHYSVKYSKNIFNPDYYWIMDDDGYPEIDCLKKLLDSERDLDYVMPVSLDIDNHENLSWPTRLKSKVKTSKYSALRDSWGDYMDYITPFNGSLLSKRCVEEVGYVNKDFFIWGDEYEHYWRCKEQGFKPYTLMEAKFYHPALKLPLVPTFFGLLHVPYVDSELRMTCLARNYTYIYLHHDNKLKIPLKIFIYTWFFLFTRKGDFSGLKLYVSSVIDGFRNKFDRHVKYIKR